MVALPTQDRQVWATMQLGTAMVGAREPMMDRKMRLIKPSKTDVSEQNCPTDISNGQFHAQTR